jgi:signal transduction histidine kinase
VFLAAVAVLGALVYGLYRHDQLNQERLFRQAADHLLHLQSEIIAREFHLIRSDLLYLSQQAALRRFVSDDSREHHSKLQRELHEEYVLFSKSKGIYDQIRYLDEEGMERIRINHKNGRPEVVPDAQLQWKASRYYFAQIMALGRDQVFVSPFDLNIEHNEIEQPIKPVIRFATPVFDLAGRKRGAMILNYLGADLLGKLADASANFAGRTLLLNNEGYFLHGPTPAQEWGFMFGNDETFSRHYGQAWEEILRRDQGNFLAAEGLFTFRTLTFESATASGSPGLGQPEPGPKSASTPQECMALRMVALVPRNVLYGSSTQMLSKLLVIYEAALALVLGLAWYLAYARVLRRHHERRIAGSEARLRRLSTRLLTAQEDERRSIARDLHDELGQLGTAVSLGLQQALHAAESAKKDQLLERARRGTDQLLETIHQLSGRIRPTMLDDLGLKEAVENLLCEFEARTGIAVHSDLEWPIDAVPVTVGQNVYRIIQEALTNVSKHARTQSVAVEIRSTGNELAARVQDDGVGFDPASLDGKRFGLLGMRERAELLGGSFALRSRPGHGTDVRVVIPFEPSQS